MKKLSYILLLLLIFSLGRLKAQSASPWTTAEQEKEITTLLSQMTLEEKVGQMTLFTSDWDRTGPTLRANYKADIEKGKVGAIFNAHTADYNRELQRISVEETRLGIPLLFGYDVVHGYRTIFPIPLGETASWNIDRAEESARIGAREAASAGLHWTFAPMVDIARDPRWGRVMEGSGEDVYLSIEMAKARIKGFQGDDLTDPFTLLACAKHFAAYGAAQAGRDYHTADISDRSLREIYLPPFQAAVDAGVSTFMTSFNDVDGLPASGSHYLLTEILRDQWGFEGFVVTDYTSINEMIPHGVAANEADAGKLAANAGVDMDMQGAVYYNHLIKQVKNGEVPEAKVDGAVRAILRMKHALGLFEDPYKYSNTDREKANILTDAHRATARAIARESIVLLKNQDQTLPLAKSIRNLAVIGPLADSKEDMLGAWHADGRAEDCVSLLSGIRNTLGANVRIKHVVGCSITDDKQSGILEAVTAARTADAIVVAVGEKWWMSGEAASRTEIGLPGGQIELIRQLAATGRPLIVVLMNGRPLAIPEVDTLADAIIETWYAGTEGGNAIADILFGEYNPSAKLPISFPRSVGQIPLFYSAKNTGRPMNPNNKYTSKYLDESNAPLYPFGYGLSYTSFAYSNLKTDKKTFKLDESLTISVKLKNTGARSGEEVVQLYVQDLVGSVTRPLRELKGFQRIKLAAGAEKEVTFSLSANDLAFYRRDMSFGPEAGEFMIYVGGSSTAEMAVKVELQ